jgi:ankyrin repeat protein
MSQEETDVIWSVKNDEKPLFEELLNEGVNVDYQDESGGTALMAAARKSHEPYYLKRLIAAHADVNRQDTAGYTALMWAVKWKNVEGAKMLLDAGAAVDMQNKFGQTAMDLAKSDSIKELLQRDEYNLPGPKGAVKKNNGGDGKPTCARVMVLV